MVVGVSGSGKTTAAEFLARVQGVPHVELDALHWEPNWQQAKLEVFRTRVEDALSGPAWVVDGNYSKSRDLTWGRATTLVWLDYSLAVTLWRLISRTIGRVVHRETLWNGNQESLRNALWGRDALIWWAIRSYQRHRKDYPQLLTCPDYAHLQVIHIRSPREADAWFERLVKEAAL